MEEPDENMRRSRIIDQLEESLAMSREMMTSKRLDANTRQKWAQLHTNTAQVLNQLLRDKQLKNWEERLRMMEARRRKLAVSIQRLEEDQSISGQDSRETNQTVRDASRVQGDC